MHVDGISLCYDVFFVVSKLTFDGSTVVIVLRLILLHLLLSLINNFSLDLRIVNIK